MRLPRFAGLFLFAVFILAARVSAATFTDEMNGIQNTAETQYFGLISFSGSTLGLSDSSMLTFSSAASPLGYALYRVNGAESVTVGIYTGYGTRVSQGDNAPVLGQGGGQALWSRSENAVYSNFGGVSWRLELDKMMYPAFSPFNAPLPQDIKGYGLNIYASSELDTLLPVSVTKSIKEATGLLCYEEYTALLPASARFVKVEINDVTLLPTSGGVAVPNRFYTRLASVMISGEALVMGEPAAVVAQPTVPAQPPASEDAKDDKDESSGKALAAKNLPKETEFEAATEMPEKKSASSKFEGTITSSPKSEKKASSKDTAAAETPSRESRRAESVSEFEPPTRDEVYEIRREKSGGLLNSGVTAYIIIVTGALVLLLVFGRNR